MARIRISNDGEVAIDDNSGNGQFVFGNVCGSITQTSNGTTTVIGDDEDDQDD